MNQTRKNLLSYANSAIHSLELVKKGRLTSAEQGEFVETIEPKIEAYVLNHNIHVSASAHFTTSKVLTHMTSRTFNAYIVWLAKLVDNAKHNHVDLSTKTEFVVELSETLDDFNFHHNLDPELNRISHMSTTELEKHIKDAGLY